MAKEKKSLSIFKVALSVAILIGIILIALIAKDMFIRSVSKPEIVTASSIYKIINVSNLSTYQCAYTDICTVMNEKKPKEVDYYCYYDATIKAGIDFSKIDVSIEESKNVNTIVVKIPKVEITETSVDITTLDYMFINKSSNSSNVSAAAYKACEQDVIKKSQEEENIKELAEKNTERIIQALIEPFINQLNDENVTYEIKIVTNGGDSE